MVSFFLNIYLELTLLVRDCMCPPSSWALEYFPLFLPLWAAMYTQVLNGFHLN